jgi:putative ABC transport system substrate-binding protein
MSKTRVPHASIVLTFAKVGPKGPAMRRREFITLLGGAAAAWPVAARGQQSAMPVIGFINPNSMHTFTSPVVAYKEGLKETGFIENQNVAIEFRWADGQYERLPGLIADLVRRRVAVLVVTGGGRLQVRIAQSATKTIPIVFNSADDPVASGLVASLNRPGGNLTGVSRLSAELMPKRLELLREVMPAASTIAIFVNENQGEADIRAKRAQETARSLNWTVEVLKVGTDSEIAAAFAKSAKSQANAILIDSNSFFNSRSELLGRLALQHAVPTIYQSREFVAAGGLMSYGASLADAYRLMGIYTGRILHGEKPADLPVQQQTKIDFIVNLKTAKALGLKMPTSILLRADEVIE